MGSSGGTTEHMVVYGGIVQREGSVSFVPNDGQPTLSEAVEAFESGIPVMLVVDTESVEASTNVLCRFSFNGKTSLGAFLVEAYMFWSSDESPDPDSGPDPVQ